MKVIWPPTIPPESGYPVWVSPWLESMFSERDIIECHCRASGQSPVGYVPSREDVYLLRCALAELIIARGHSASMVGDRIEIEFDMSDPTVRAACGLR